MTSEIAQASEVDRRSLPSIAMSSVRARVGDDFGAGPFKLEVEGELESLDIDERLIVAFSDFEGLFTVIGRARGAIHLGMYLSPWSYIHWRAEHSKGRWSLQSNDRIEITRLKRVYRLAS